MYAVPLEDDKYETVNVLWHQEEVMQPRPCQRCGPKADRRLFGQTVITAESRKLKIKDGSRRKTNIAALAKGLEKNVSPVGEISEPSETVIYRMSLV